MIEIRNLAFSYGENTILRDVSFVVSPGETVSIVGANGAGKTTLLRILASLAVPDSGTVMMDGQDALKYPLKYRRHLGYLPETTALYEDMRVKEYLRYRAFLKGEGAKRVRRRVNEAAEMCRITNLMDARIHELSAGLKKRVALADALLLRPRMLILDDFLAGLDRNMRESAGEILQEAAAFSNVIITGHELADFAKWTTRFLVLKNGVIAASVDTAGVDQSTLVDRVVDAMGGGIDE